MKSKLTLMILTGALALSAVAPSAMAGDRSVSPRARGPVAVKKAKAVSQKSNTPSHTIAPPNATYGGFRKAK